MDIVVITFLQVFLGLLNFYSWAIFIRIILSLLLQIGLINLENHVMDNIFNFLYTITEPLLNLARRIIPPFGMLDFSPIVAYFFILLLSNFIVKIIAHIQYTGF